MMRVEGVVAVEGGADREMCQILNFSRTAEKSAAEKEKIFQNSP